MRIDLFIKKNLELLLKNSGLSDSVQKKIVLLPRSFWQKELLSGNIKFKNNFAKPSINIDILKISSLSFNWKNIKNNWLAFYEKNLIPKKIKIEYLKKKSDFLAVNKPVGIAIHPSFPLKRGLERQVSLIEGIIYDFPEIAKCSEQKDGERPGVVHRLDKNTSGVLIVARNSEYKNYLKSLFKKRLIDKTYLALVEGLFPLKKFKISGFIGKTTFNPLKRGVDALELNGAPIKKSVKILNPKSSITLGNLVSGGTLDSLTKDTKGDYHKILLQWKKHIKDKDHNFSLIELKLLTGRTHQLRAHLSAVGFPVVGDALYGSSHKNLNFHFLHAYKITWINQLGEKELVIADKVAQLK